jgi:hypothetical protein
MDILYSLIRTVACTARHNHLFCHPVHVCILYAYTVDENTYIESIFKVVVHVFMLSFYWLNGASLLMNKSAKGLSKLQANLRT